MKENDIPKLFFVFIMIMLFVSACSNAGSLEPSSSSVPITPSETVPVNLPGNGYFELTSPPTEEPSLLLTAFPPTDIPTKTPSVTRLPGPTVTPAVRIDPGIHPLALDSNAIAVDTQLLRRIGTGKPNDVLWSPDGEYLAIATSRGIFLYDGQTFEEIRFIDLGKNVVTLAFSPDNREMAVALNNRVGVWNVASGQQVNFMDGGFESRIEKVIFGAGGHIAAVGNNCGGCGDVIQTLAVWDGQSGKQLYFEGGAFWYSNAIDISPDGDTLIFFPGSFVFLDLLNRNDIVPLDDDLIFIRPMVLELLIGPDNKHIFVSTKVRFESEIKNYLVPLDGSLSQEILEGVDCLGAKKNATYAVCHGDRRASVFDLLDGQEIVKIFAGGRIMAVGVDPSGSHLAIMEEDKVLVFDVDSKEQVKSFDFFPFDVIDTGTLSIKNTQRYVAATTGRDGIVNIWDLSIGEVSDSIVVSEERIKSLALSPDGHSFVAIDSIGILRLVDTNNFVVKEIYNFNDENFYPMVINNDGQQVAVSIEGNIYVLDLNDETPIRKASLESLPAPAPYSTFFYDFSGNLLGWQAGFYKISLINLDRDEETSFNYDHSSYSDRLEAVSLSSDGRFAAFGMVGSQILIGDTSSLELIGQLRGHITQSGEGFIGGIQQLLFSPVFSEILLSVGYDHTVRLWNVKSGLELRRLDACCYAGFPEDGRLLVTAGDSVIEVWGVPPLP